LGGWNDLIQEQNRANEMRLGMNMTITIYRWVHHKTTKIWCSTKYRYIAIKKQNVGVLTKGQNSGQSKKYAIYRYATQNNKIMVFHKNNRHQVNHKY